MFDFFSRDRHTGRQDPENHATAPPLDQRRPQQPQLGDDELSTVIGMKCKEHPWCAMAAFARKRDAPKLGESIIHFPRLSNRFEH